MGRPTGGANKRKYPPKNAKQIREAPECHFPSEDVKTRAETDAFTAALMREHEDRYAQPVPDTSISVPKRYHRQDVPMPQSSMGLI